MTQFRKYHQKADGTIAIILIVLMLSATAYKAGKVLVEIMAGLL